MSETHEHDEPHTPSDYYSNEWEANLPWGQYECQYPVDHQRDAFHLQYDIRADRTVLINVMKDIYLLEESLKGLMDKIQTLEKKDLEKEEISDLLFEYFYVRIKAKIVYQELMSILKHGMVNLTMSNKK